MENIKGIETSERKHIEYKNKINENQESIKISTLLNTNNKSIQYSFEYFLPRNRSEHAALINLVKTMVKDHSPCYIDLTWRGNISVLNDHINLVSNIQLVTGLQVMLHIACAQLSISDCDYVLSACRDRGICNIMALRGDVPNSNLAKQSKLCLESNLCPTDLNLAKQSDSSITLLSAADPLGLTKLCLESNLCPTDLTNGTKIPSKNLVSEILSNIFAYPVKLTSLEIRSAHAANNIEIAEDGARRSRDVKLIGDYKDDDKDDDIKLTDENNYSCKDENIDLMDHNNCGYKSRSIKSDDNCKGIKSGNKNQKFSCALEFVKHIRKYYGDYFCIAVAGYPEGHPSSGFDMKTEVEYTTSKVLAGADFIVTQGCFDAQKYHTYISALREHGVQVPIIPGILLYKNRTSFLKMTKYCNISIPEEWKDELELRSNKLIDTKDDADLVGKKLVTNLVRGLSEDYGYRQLHLFTLNDKQSVDDLLERLRD